jgi:hypothetical protein
MIKKKEKYVLLDSNIYIHLCFADLDLEGDLLDKLKKMLDKDKFKLLLPEVVQIEFDKRFNEKRIGLDQEIEGLSNKAHQIREGKTARDNLIKSIKETKKQILIDIEKLKEEISKIFNHKNTIKQGLELGPEIFVEAYKFYLKKQKPYKMPEKNESLGNIQPDCLIIASVGNYLKSKENYNLYFSTGNKEDFVRNPKEENKNKFELVESVKKYFKDITYCHDTLKMLNENFDAGYALSTIKKFEERKEKGLLNYASIFPSILASEISLPSGLQLSDSLSHISVDDGSILARAMSPSILNRGDLAYHVTNRVCARCGESYYHGPTSVLIDNGLCPKCNTEPRSGIIGM